MNRQRPVRRRMSGFAHLFLFAALAAPLFGITACSAAPEQAAAVSTPLELSEDGREPVGRLMFRGGIVLRGDDPRLGGLSDIRIGDDGTQFAAVSDSSAALVGRLTYDQTGRLTGAKDIEVVSLNGVDGTPLSGKQGDAEGLVRLPDGGWLVSFEREHRVLHYPSGLGQGRPRRLNLPAEVADLPTNGGLEAMTRLADDRLLLIAEDGENGVHLAWIGREGEWTTLGYRAHPPFRPVSAATLPNGDLLVLERRASWIGGWGSRIVLVPAANLERAADGRGILEGTEIGRIDPPMAADNYEGVDVRVSSDGRTLVYLVSDDNFMFTQRTIILMFELLAE